MNSNRWLFSKERLANSPSRHHGIDEDKELSYLQVVSNFIQDMGRELSLPLLCMNTAIIFTQRFYVYHPLTVFEKFSLGASALFLAAKVEEQPRKVQDVCSRARKFGLLGSDTKDEDYINDLLMCENILLQTLGFEVKVQHPHQHVLLLCELIKASKLLARTSYILATYCLHLTKMCLSYSPSVIACVCIHTAAKMLGIKIPIPRDGKSWYLHVDASLTNVQLDSLTVDFVTVLKKCPDKFKSKTIKNLVKKLGFDSSFAGFQATKTVPDFTIQNVEETQTDGLSSTLKEEYSLITSSLLLETEHCSAKNVTSKSLCGNSGDNLATSDKERKEKHVMFSESLNVSAALVGPSQSQFKRSRSIFSPKSALSPTKTDVDCTCSVIDNPLCDTTSRTIHDQGKINFGININAISAKITPYANLITKSNHQPQSKLAMQQPSKNLNPAMFHLPTVPLTSGVDGLGNVKRVMVSNDPINSGAIENPQDKGRETSRIHVPGIKEPSLKISIPKDRIWCLSDQLDSNKSIFGTRVKPKSVSPAAKKFKTN